MRSLLPLILLAIPAWPQPASLAGFSDNAAFHVYLNEERFGRLTSQWKPDGFFESTARMEIAGQVGGGGVTLTPDAEGRWVKATQREEIGENAFLREGRNFTATLRHGNKGQGTLPEEMLTFEEYSPALITQALRRYDAAKGGAQTFLTFLLKDPAIEELTLRRQETEERTVNGRTLKLTHWLYSLPKWDIRVIAGDDGRVYVATGMPWLANFGMSETDAAYVREGFESLRPTPAADPLISQPTFQVKAEPGIKIPMRDGIRLSTDIYLPIGSPKAPVILVRTPYLKEFGEFQARYYARRGYAFAIQDVRGRFASEGKWEPLVNEPKDGYDTIEWLARQPWSSGKVGMIGASYLGWVQWFAATLHPPHLAAMIPNVSPPDPFHNLPFDYGILDMAGSLHWVDMVESKATADLTGVLEDKVETKNYTELFKPLPVIDGDKAVTGSEVPFWRRWMAHPAPDSYWSPTMFLDKLKDFKIPVFHQSGWFDADGIGSKLNYAKVASYGRATQKLTLGPWDHSDTASRTADRKGGAAAAIDLQRDYLRWFDRWLKGIDNGIDREPAVSLYVMGSNRWLHGPKYPLPETRFEKLYLSGGGHANTSGGDGKLTFTPPAANQPADHYVYDPGDPTPESNYGGDRAKVTAARQDILLYTTAPFDKPYTIAGPVSAVLYAASSARDTDWFVHVWDIDPDGKSAPLWSHASGKVRARYRGGMAKPQLLTPGKIYRYDLDLWQTGITLTPGHRLQIEVSSAAFPLFGRNLNTGGNNETETRFISASQTIYHDAAHPSHILLPVIP